MCGNEYQAYGCCDWCDDEGLTYDPNPFKGTCYPRGTRPVDQQLTQQVGM
jgi:hypothetical protein